MTLDQLPSKLVEHINSCNDPAFPFHRDGNVNLLAANRSAFQNSEFAIVLHAPIQMEVVHAFGRQHELRIPSMYAELLTTFNGASIYRIGLFGIPLPSPPQSQRKDRSEDQPEDLAVANTTWRQHYAASEDEFYFGGSDWHGDDDVIGYFLCGDGKIKGYLEGGPLVQEWADLNACLADECERNYRNYPEWESIYRYRPD